MGLVIDVYIVAKRSKSGHRFGFVRFINVNDINQLVSNLRTAWIGGFHLFADVAKYGRTYNRPVTCGCLPLASWAPEVYKKLVVGGEARVLQDMSGFSILREEDVRGVESDLVELLKKGEIRDDSVNVVNVTTDDKEMYYAKFCSEKDSQSLRLHLHPGIPDETMEY
ncbi:RNA-directed DNA polymerase, eukaryota, nucleotide-binding alpha-beta plait domain protein [Tanacetum coccineum]